MPRRSPVPPRRRRVPVLTLLMVTGVLVLELGFIASYVGALHAPTPSGVPVALVGPSAARSAVARGLELAGESAAVRVVPEPDVVAARAAVGSGAAYAVFVPGTARDTLLVADAASPFVASALTSIFRGLATASGARLDVVDMAPLPAGDPVGLSAFYLSVGWVVGGYLVAAVLGVGAGMSAESRRAAASRVSAIVAFSIASGLIGALIVDQWLGALRHHTLELAGVGALVVLATALSTAALETVLGLAGTALAIAAFVVVGNPSSGGPFAAPLLPRFFGAVGGYLPPGAATRLVRSVTYFSGAGTTHAYAVLGSYAVLGALVTVALAGQRRPYVRLLPE
ncbi:MAG TPA: hypothetical protein VND23_09325 [Acidimicrobiales bacterium]|nr:hypothetical protein [Acidimicrobiales bacterium]